MIKAILAMNDLRIIGHNNQLPWYCPEDLARFKRLTQGQTVIMGRKTWESLPERFRPLPGRDNIVVSASKGIGPLDPRPTASGATVAVAHSLIQALSWVPSNQDAWIIGGASLFEQAIPYIDQVELTVLHNNTIDGDCKLPDFEHLFTLTKQEPIVREDRVIGYTYVKAKR